MLDNPVPDKINIAILAPKLAALETPKVEGDAIGFFNVCCINNPLKDKLPPTIKAPNVLGILILYKIFMFSLLPLLNNAFNESKKDILLDPMHKETKKSIIKIKIITKKEIRFFLFIFFLDIFNSSLFFCTNL